MCSIALDKYVVKCDVAIYMHFQPKNGVKRIRKNSIIQPKILNE